MSHDLWMHILLIIPFLLVDETTVPIYERNYNINLSFKSKYPLPVTLISMTWGRRVH